MSTLKFPCNQNTIMIPAACGHLEAITSCADEDRDDDNMVAIICHPHPLYGGTMTNKVVHTLAKTMHLHGMHTVRFNFRGVGKSDGQYDNTIGETDDLQAVVDWVRERMPGYSVCLAGFSFGSYICLKLAQTIPMQQLITVAPPVNIFDFSMIRQPDCPWVLIQGEQDEIVDAEKVRQWASQFPDVVVEHMADSGHFFHGKLNSLQERLSRYLGGLEDHSSQYENISTD